MPPSRQLAAVMFSDIEGFSALMQKHEDEAIRVKDKYQKVIDACHSSFNGKVVHFYGDGCLSIFSSVMDAINCAVAMQAQYRENKRVPVRIGLHLGDIVISGNDVFGDGVNLASRIESLGVAGGILLSDKVKDELHNHPELKTVSLGKYRLKNIEKEVEVFALANDGLAVPEAGSLTGKTEQKKNSFRRRLIITLSVVLILALAITAYFKFSSGSKIIPDNDAKKIAVLPFRNISNSKENDYLSDGITEEMIATLSGVSNLKVISRSSTQQYKNSNKSPKQIGGELGISALIDGSVIKEGNNVRINVQLIDVRTEEVLWSENFSKTVSEILIFYGQVVQQVAHRLDVAMSDVEINRLQKTETINPELHQLYLKGLFNNNKFTLESYNAAIQFYNRALQIKPDYAPALAGKALSYTLMGVFNPAISTTEALPQVLKLAGEAMAADSTQAAAYLALGYARMFFQHNLSLAGIALERAIDLEPSNDMVITGLILMNLYEGNTDSARYWLQKGKAISPFSFFLTHHEGRILFLENKQEEAFEAYKKAIAIFDHPLLYDHLASLYNEAGRYNETITLLDSMMKTKDAGPSTLAWMAEANYKKGNKERAQSIINKMEIRANEHAPDYPYFTAVYYISIGDKEKAFAYLDKAVAQNDVDLLWLKEERRFAPVHNDPRYTEKLRQAGFKTHDIGY